MEYPLSLDSAKYSLCSYFSSVSSNTQQPAVIPVLYSHEAPPAAAAEAVPGTLHTRTFLHAGSLRDKRFQCGPPWGQCQQGDIYQ